MALTSPGVDISRLMGPVNGAFTHAPTISSALPSLSKLLQQTIRTSRSCSARKAAGIMRKIMASDCLLRKTNSFQIVRLAFPAVCGDFETHTIKLDEAHMKLAACTVGTLSSFLMIALPAVSAVDVGVALDSPVAAESSRSAPSVERILAEQLAARFREMSHKELVQMIEQLLQAPPLRSQTECTASSPSPQSQSQPATPPQSLNTPREDPTLHLDIPLPLPPTVPAPAPSSFLSSNPLGAGASGSQATDQATASVGTSPDLAADVARADDSSQATAGSSEIDESDESGGSDERNPDITASLWQAWEQRQNSTTSATSATSAIPMRTLLLPQGLEESYWRTKAVQGAQGVAVAWAVALASVAIASISNALPSTWKDALSRNLLAPGVDKLDRQVAGTGEGSEGDGNRRVGAGVVTRLLQSVRGDGEGGVGKQGGGSRQVESGGMGFVEGEGSDSPPDVALRRKGRRRKEAEDASEEELWWKAPGLPIDADGMAREQEADVARPGDPLAAADVATADVAPPISEREIGYSDDRVVSSRPSATATLEPSVGRGHGYGQSGNGGFREREKELEGDEGGRGEGGSSSNSQSSGSGVGDVPRQNEGVGKEGGREGGGWKGRGRREVEAEPLIHGDATWREHTRSHVQWKAGIGQGQIDETNGNGASEMGNKEGFGLRGGSSRAGRGGGIEHARVYDPYGRVKGLGGDGGSGRLDYWGKAGFGEGGLGPEADAVRNGGEMAIQEGRRKEEGGCMGGHGGRGVDLDEKEEKKGVLGCRLDWFIHKGVVWRRGSHGVFVQAHKRGEM